ncbi:methyl-accepting chemotaxis protein [Paenibacillus sp. sgz500958]|uniref:methyl-accepting chemotaxis protein n=1 Tax=Paenibacillus sp. sgz500958 TaxID=3242475 RepID=UPI0036D25C21
MHIKKKLTTIRSQMIITYVAVLLIPSLIIGFFSYQASSNKIEKQLMQSALESVKVAVQIADETIRSKMTDIAYYNTQFTSDQIDAEVDGTSGASLSTKLKEYTKLHPDVLNIMIGTDQGNIIQASDEKLPADFDPRTRDWYKNAKKADKKAVVSPAYLSPDGNITVPVSITLPDAKGVVVLNIDLKKLGELTNVKVGEKGYIFITDAQKTYLVHPTEKIGTVSTRDFVNAMFTGKSGTYSYSFNGEGKKLVYVTSELTGWKFGGSFYTSEINDAVAGIRNTIVIVLLASIFLISFIIIYIVRAIMKPMNRLKLVTEQVSNGDLTKDIDGFRDNEFGDLANNFQRMVVSLRQTVSGVQEMTNNLSSSAEELQASSKQTTLAVEHVTSAIQEVAAGSEQQVLAVERGMEGVQATTDEVGRIVESMNLVSTAMTRTSDTAMNGNNSVVTVVQKITSIQSTVEELNETMSKLEVRAQNIGGIVNVIFNISKQTNLLALNASIEAARAGEHGKGFMVVASEVRKLAENSQESARQISELISAMNEEMSFATATMKTAIEGVAEGVDAVDLSSRSFSRILKAVRSVNTQIEGMVSSVAHLSEQSQVMEDAILSIRSISQESSANTQMISAASQQQLASMEEIASSSTNLGVLAAELQLKVEHFKL